MDKNSWKEFVIRAISYAGDYEKKLSAYEKYTGIKLMTCDRCKDYNIDANMHKCIKCEDIVCKDCQHIYLPDYSYHDNVKILYFDCPFCDKNTSPYEFQDCMSDFQHICLKCLTSEQSRRMLLNWKCCDHNTVYLPADDYQRATCDCNHERTTDFKSMKEMCEDCDLDRRNMYNKCICESHRVSDFPFEISDLENTSWICEDCDGLFCQKYTDEVFRDFNGEHVCYDCILQRKGLPPENLD